MAGVRMDRREFLAAIGSAAFALNADGAESPKIEVGPTRRIGAEGTKHVEPWIAANPRDPSNLVIVSARYLDKVSTRMTFRMEPTAYFSADGATWSPAAFEDEAELTRGKASFCDAFATFAPDGTAFCVFCGSIEGTGLDLRVYRSDDGGRHWRSPTALTDGGWDYPRLVADMAAGRPRLFLAVATEGDRPILGASRRPGCYGCAVLRSDDGARTFSAVNFLAPTRLQHDPIDAPLVLPDGRLLVGFTDYPGAAGEGTGRREHLALGRTYTAWSRDGGATFSTPAPICETPIWGGHSVLTADASDGPRRGWVYAVACRKTATPHMLQVQSSKDGTDWTAPVPVPGLGAGPVLFTAAAVSSRGVLGVMWLQGEPGSPTSPADKALGTREFAWSLYFTASADGGATFATPVSLLKSPSRTDPSLPRWAHGTDYLCLTAPTDGCFHLIWVDTRGGTGQLQTAKIEVRP